MNIYVKKGVSKKTGRDYVAMVADLGYREAVLTFSDEVCAECLGLSKIEMYLKLAQEEKIKIN